MIGATGRRFLFSSRGLIACAVNSFGMKALGPSQVWRDSLHQRAVLVGKGSLHRGKPWLCVVGSVQFSYRTASLQVGF